MQTVLVVGAGPAGLTVAKQLEESSIPVIVVEAGRWPGGSARSFCWHGTWCDIGAHRFVADGVRMRDLVGCELGLRRLELRGSLHWRGIQFQYPITPIKLMAGLPPLDTLKYAQSFLLRSRRMNDDTLESVCNAAYGSQFSRDFIGGYTERLLGISPDRISGDYARRKVGFAKDRDASRVAHGQKYFWYPSSGGFGGRLIEFLSSSVAEVLKTNTRLVALRWTDNSVEAAGLRSGSGVVEWMNVSAVVSTIPIGELASMLGGVRKLSMRPLDVIYALLDVDDATGYHWQYVFEHDLPCTRIAEFKRFTQTSNLGHSVVAIEVPGRSPSQPDDLVRTLVSRGYIRGRLKDLNVIRVPDAYPVWDITYKGHLAESQDVVDRYENVWSIGRGGAFAHWEVDEVIESSRTAMDTCIPRLRELGASQ